MKRGIEEGVNGRAGYQALVYRMRQELQSININERDVKIYVLFNLFSIITKKSVDSVINERNLLANLNCPFLVNIHYAFQDRDVLYLVLDLMEGGDLRYHMSTRSFSEIEASTQHHNH